MEEQHVSASVPSSVTTSGPTIDTVSHPRRWIYALVVPVVATAAWTLFSWSTGGVSVSAVSSTTEVAAGRQLTVDIVLDTDGFSVTAADVVVLYDATKLKALAINPGAFLPITLAAGTVTEGRAAITVGSGTTPAVGAGVVASLTFETIAQGEARIEPGIGTRVAATDKKGDVVGELVPVVVMIR